MVDQFNQSRTFLLELIILIIELFYLLAQNLLSAKRTRPLAHQFIIAKT
jgi:hypothetical protein